MAIGIVPPTGSGPALQDGDYLLGLSYGINRNFQNALVAKAGGTKAAAIQLAARIAIFSFKTVVTNGDSALLPEAIAGHTVHVRNAGVATLSLYARGANTINGAAAAANYDLTANQSAYFFCAINGAWSAIKSA